MENGLTRVLAALLVGSALAAPAMAAEQITEEDLAQIDANGDGVVTEDEYVAYMDTIFDALDPDDTGGVSFAEIDFLLTRTQHNRMDANGDGLVSKSEWDAQMRSDFEIGDVDGDGVLN